MAPAPTIPFVQFAPDLTSLGPEVTSVVENVVPQADGYGPFSSLESFTRALPAANRGFYFARRSDGSIAVFAGTVTELYLLDNTTFNWTNVSKGGGPYGDLVAANNWRFRQFNDLVVAVQVNTAPQKFTLSSSTDFEDLGGSPPAAGHVAVVNRFIVLTSLLSNPRRVQWCDLDAPETWTAGVGLADFQDLPDGGSVFGLSGGDAYGLVFQNESIRSLTYAPGSAVTFQINRISTQDTLFAEYSIINAGDLTLFISAQGFKMVRPGGKPEPIGKERVDRFFFRDFDRGNLQLVIGASDPTSNRAYWAYKSGQGLTGLFDKILVYDIPLEKWSLITGVSGEWLESLAKPGLTLEQLDAIAPTPLNVLGAANNGSGAIRLTLDAVSNSDFAIAGQNFIVVQGVEGTIEANGTWSVTIIDPTHIDLIGSTFTNAWTQGGQIGGSLDALPFSLDSISKSAVAALSAFDSSHKLGFFSGPHLEAIIDTSEKDYGGDLAFVTGVRPMTDAPGCYISIGSRYSPQEAVSYSAEELIDTSGFAGPMVEARYLRGRLRIPAGTAWTYARALQAEVQAAGEE